MKRIHQMKLEQPIPGENFTSDTRNMPWHRPPDLNEYDEAIDYFISKLEEPEQQELTFAMLEIDTQITTVVATVLLQGIRVGKIGIDLAILIAGPLARFLEIQAKGVGIKYDMGIDDEDRIVITPTLLRAALGIVTETPLDPEDVNQTLEEEKPEIPEPLQGLMSMPTPDSDSVATQEEQTAMLGGEEEPVEEEV